MLNYSIYIISVIDVLTIPCIIFLFPLRNYKILRNQHKCVTFIEHLQAL